MGCICSKGISESELLEGKRSKSSIKRLKKRLVSSSKSKREEAAVGDADTSVGNDGSRARLIPEPEEEAVATPLPLLLIEREEEEEEEKEEVEVAVAAVDRSRTEGVGQHRFVGGDVERSSKVVAAVNGVEPPKLIATVPNGFDVEHVAAGWPSWLVTVAGEAVKGWLPRRAESFEKLDKIGQGTYSNVYKARDLETGKIVALKKVRFVNMDPESVRFMSREIYILRKLDHPNVVKLEGLVTSRRSCSLYLVFEYMEHDLAGLAATPGIKFPETQVKCYMQQLLRGLDHCHSHGVLHRDIKGSNLLIDNNGILKIADFGLATFFNHDQKQQLTSRVVTLWYRPPELLLGATEYDVAVDLWSTGCILAELLVGKPIMPGRTEVEQLHKIFKLCGSPSEEFWRKSKLPHATVFKPQHPYRRCVGETFGDLPTSTFALLDRLLAIDPADRGTAASALKSEFFTMKPLPCDPSSLPKYPPSKELDAKLRDEEARRQRAAAIKDHKTESVGRGSMDSKAPPLPDADAELQKRHLQGIPKSRSTKYNQQDDGGSRFQSDPSRETSENGFSRNGHLGAYGSSYTKKTEDQHHVPGSSASSGLSNGAESRTQRPYMNPGSGADLPNLAGLGPRINRTGKSADHRDWPEHMPMSRYSQQLDAANSSEKQEWFHHLLDRPASSHKKDNKMDGKEPTMGYAAKKNRIHYSGPLMPPGENIEEMLREHERQIQQAVRKARLDRAKMKGYGEAKVHQSETLLYNSRNGRADV